MICRGGRRAMMRVDQSTSCHSLFHSAPRGRLSMGGGGKAGAGAGWRAITLMLVAVTVLPEFRQCLAVSVGEGHSQSRVGP